MTPTDQPTLKPCPFCSCNKTSIINGSVVCTGCKSQASLNIWNIRFIEEEFRTELNTKNKENTKNYRNWINAENGLQHAHDLCLYHGGREVQNTDDAALDIERAINFVVGYWKYKLKQSLKFGDFSKAPYAFKYLNDAIAHKETKE